ncbi:ATP-binding cassette domain-containing protein [Lujinxingia vulgaris]|uniref:ATP-binding cassette domain-containing protein n=1 Tax=Lujinxingia vulgaris TaxID=2600176 RepID=A0A5C6X9U4_9DELT|nr:ATP-binding cassette domain-containing protein [Lujinxingia vulgaris]TXD35513.1 ATP-binding cassette domain-containing protein [Lujinxingia vulgaris]
MIALYDVKVPTCGEGRADARALSWRVERGQWAEVVGGAGSGKSALFEVITLMSQPSSGRLVVAGRNLERVGRAGLSAVRREIGACAQWPPVLAKRTVVEHAVLPMVARGGASGALAAAEAVLEGLGLEHLRDVPGGQLSAQERMLVGVMMATVGSPKLVVIDAVHEALEAAWRGRVLSWLWQLKERGSTVVVLGRRPTSRSSGGEVLRLDAVEPEAALC